MIVVDTSALMAIALDEAQAETCSAALVAADGIMMSAATVAEALIVSMRRSVHQEMERMLDGLGIEIISLTPASALRVVDAYQRWGKGFHPAGLNFGDCFAYELAKERESPLLFVGDDFAQTDVERVL